MSQKNGSLVWHPGPDNIDFWQECVHLYGLVPYVLMQNYYAQAKVLVIKEAVVATT